MISGPTPPHPRVILKALLQDGASGSGSSSIESGLEMLESDLRVGNDLRVDFLARDASGMPVLVLAVDEEDEQWAPLHIADLELWFRDNAHLLERAVSQNQAGRSLSWMRGFRIVVVALDVPARFFRRLELLRGVQMDVYELRSVFVRGETRWLLRGVAPWASADTDGVLPRVPQGLEDPELGELASSLIERAAALSADIEVRGDRFERDFRWRGETLLALQVREGRLRASVSDRGAALLIRNSGDVDEVLDRCLRKILETCSAPEPTAASPHEFPRVPLRPRIVSDSRLSDDELSAFYDSSSGG